MGGQVVENDVDLSAVVVGGHLVHELDELLGTTALTTPELPP